MDTVPAKLVDQWIAYGNVRSEGKQVKQNTPADALKKLQGATNG